MAHARVQHPGPWWPAAAAADVGDGKAKAYALGWCSVRTRAGTRQPEATAAARAQWWPSEQEHKPKGSWRW